MNELKNIIQAIEGISKQLEEIGMTKKTIEVFMSGESEVLNCAHCKTPNMIELTHNDIDYWSMYECNACKKTYLMDWKNKEDYTRLKLI